MRKRVGLALGRDIGRNDMLEEVKKEGCETKRAAALEAILEVEAEGHEKMQLAEGVARVCELLDERQIPRAILTRNSKDSLDYFHDRLPGIQEFFPAVSRDCGFPPKPYPDALQHICDKGWGGMAPTEVIMIGDSPKDDVRAGRRAGAITVLLGKEAARSDLPEEMEPDYKIADLTEFHALLEREFDLISDASAGKDEAVRVGEESLK